MSRLDGPKREYNPYAAPVASTEVPLGEADDDDLDLPAERITRWWARFIDDILVVLTFLPAVFAIGADFRGKDPPLLAYGLGGVPLVLVIYQWFLISTQGQTLGKKWTRIRVVRVDGSPLGFVHGVLLREWVLTLGGLIPYLGAIVGLVDALMIFGDERRCLHDHVAGTKVVLALERR